MDPYLFIQVDINIVKKLIELLPHHVVYNRRQKFVEKRSPNGPFGHVANLNREK